MYVKVFIMLSGGHLNRVVLLGRGRYKAIVGKEMDVSWRPYVISFYGQIYVWPRIAPKWPQDVGMYVGMEF